MSGTPTYELARVGLSDGSETTVYLVRHPLADHHRAGGLLPRAPAAGPLVRRAWTP